MQALRSSLIGTVILALIGSAGGVAFAAEPEAPVEQLASMSCDELESAATADDATADATTLDPAVELARRCMSCEELDAARGPSADVPIAVNIAATVVHGERCEAGPAEELAPSVEERRSTFTIERFNESVEDQYGVDEAGVPTHTVLRTMTVKASDPRLSGTWTEDWICQYGEGDFPGFEVCVGSVRVGNGGGSWLGSADSIYVTPATSVWTVLEGQGGYAGLTAIVHSSVGIRRDIREGVVLDFDMPTRPELPAG